MYAAAAVYLITHQWVTASLVTEANGNATTDNTRNAAS